MKKIIVFLPLFLLCTVTFNSCKKKQDQKKSYTLNSKPTDNPTEVHIWGNSDMNQSGVEVPEIGAAAWTSGETIFMRAALKFDLSSIPADAVITSAKLTLYSNHTPLNGDGTNANSGSDNTLLIQQITNSWTTGLVSWSNQPVATEQNQIVIPSTTSPFLDLVDIDVTTLIKNMVNNNTNYGFLIRLQSEQVYNSRIFCSSKYSDTSRFPKLFIEYSH